MFDDVPELVHLFYVVFGFMLLVGFSVPFLVGVLTGMASSRSTIAHGTLIGFLVGLLCLCAIVAIYLMTLYWFLDLIVANWLVLGVFLLGGGASLACVLARRADVAEE